MSSAVFWQFSLLVAWLCDLLIGFTAQLKNTWNTNKIFTGYRVKCQSLLESSCIKTSWVFSIPISALDTKRHDMSSISEPVIHGSIPWEWHQPVAAKTSKCGMQIGQSSIFLLRKNYIVTVTFFIEFSVYRHDWVCRLPCKKQTNKKQTDFLPKGWPCAFSNTILCVCLFFPNISAQYLKLILANMKRTFPSWSLIQEKTIGESKKKKKIKANVYI